MIRISSEWRKAWQPLALGGLLAGCSSLELLEVLSAPSPDAPPAAAARMDSGFLTISHEKGTCGGRYLTEPGTDPDAIPIECTDGRRGIASTDAQSNGVTGRMRLEDGTELVFLVRDLETPALGSSRTAPKARIGG